MSPMQPPHPMDGALHGPDQRDLPLPGQLRVAPARSCAVAVIAAASRVARPPALPGDGSRMVSGRCSLRGTCRDRGAGWATVGASGCRGCTRSSNARSAHSAQPW